MGSISATTGDSGPISTLFSAPVPWPPTDVLVSLRTGRVRPYPGGKFSSGINKQPREGRVRLTKLGLADDERDYAPHRSPDNALHQYDPAHYQSWRETLSDRDHQFQVGAFGENLSMTRLSESNLCVGDIFRLGPDALVQVTMPRQPCFKLNARFQYKKMSSLAQKTGRTGWYYRVIREGTIAEGDEMVLVERINPRWSLSRVQHILYRDVSNRECIEELCTLPALSSEMLTLFRKRLQSGAEDFASRLSGVVWLPYRLVEKSDLTPRVKKFVFAADGASISPDEAGLGRFPNMRLKFGPAGKFTRAYSVVSGDLGSFELGVARNEDSRGGSAYLHDELNVGDVVRGSEGHSAPQADCQAPRPKRHIFIMGGIGVTAFLPEIRGLTRERLPDLEVHYAVRSRAEAAYADALPPERTTVYARSEGRRLNLEHAIPAPSEPAAHDAAIYCCGPASLMDACRNVAARLGYPESLLHFEEFGSALSGTGDPFEAEIKSSGRVLQVPGDKSLLQALTEAGFDIDSSCMVGNCGTCMVEYCRGTVKHQGTALNDEQKEDTMLSCVSRGHGKVVIEP